MSDAIENDNLDLQTVIEEVKKEFRVMLGKRKDLIIKLGEALERKVSDSESICEEIKNELREEIAQNDLSQLELSNYIVRISGKRKPSLKR
jgi:hypothetical protein